MKCDESAAVARVKCDRRIRDPRTQAHTHTIAATARESTRGGTHTHNLATLPLARCGASLLYLERVEHMLAARRHPVVREAEVVVRAEVEAARRAARQLERELSLVALPVLQTRVARRHAAPRQPKRTPTRRTTIIAAAHGGGRRSPHPRSSAAREEEEEEEKEEEHARGWCVRGGLRASVLARLFVRTRSPGRRSTRTGSSRSAG